MTKILVCAATALELEALGPFAEGVETLVTGAGSPSTAFFLAAYFSKKIPGLAIQAGITGSFRPEIGIGQVVQVREDYFADLGAQDRDGSFIPLDTLIREKNNPFQAYRLEPPDRYIMSGVLEVRAVTVNRVSGRQEEIDQMIKRLQPDIESMEGAAFFASCMVHRVPCLQLRAVSNRVEPRNRESWDIPLALNRLQESLARLQEILF
ncbi:MAG TPA: futalosine hydrolase [Saprospiraceae bacterium]|nr:futalosine hydrolase [Saprospiraceae bacterium]HNT22084.1 futalosine hydrolase [Saprospiraceae bacterium]